MFLGLMSSGEYLIAIQVTAINTGIKKKFESTINISPTFTEGKNVLLIMIALNFQDFDANYGTFTEVTSSPSPTVKARYENWWYGQPCDFEPISALYYNIEQYMKI